MPVGYILAGIGGWWLAVGCHPDSIARIGAHDDGVTSTPQLLGENSGDLTPESVLDWQPKTHAEYVTAIRRLRTESTKSTQANQQLISFLNGNERVVSCVLGLPIKQLSLKITGTNHAGVSLAEADAQSEVDANHRMLIYLGADTASDLVVAADGYRLFKSEFIDLVTTSRHISDITGIMIKQEGEDYFDGEPFTITAIELSVGNPLRTLFSSNSESLEFTFAQTGDAMRIGTEMLKWNQAYQRMLGINNCGSR